MLEVRPPQAKVDFEVIVNFITELCEPPIVAQNLVKFLNLHYHLVLSVYLVFRHWGFVLAALGLSLMLVIYVYVGMHYQLKTLVKKELNWARVATWAEIIIHQVNYRL